MDQTNHQALIHQALSWRKAGIELSILYGIVSILFGMSGMEEQTREGGPLSFVLVAGFILLSDIQATAARR